MRRGERCSENRECSDLQVGRGSGFVDQRALEKLQVVRGDGGRGPPHAQFVVKLGLGKTNQKIYKCEPPQPDQLSSTPYFFATKRKAVMLSPRKE